MYGAVPPKMKRPDPQGDAVEMQPLMVDPYFDKSFAPEVNYYLTSFLNIEIKCSTNYRASFYFESAKYIFRRETSCRGIDNSCHFSDWNSCFL